MRARVRRRSTHASSSGPTLRAAEQTAKRAGCSVRVVRRDGEDLIRTDDAVNDRINVEVEQDLVVRIVDVI